MANDGISSSCLKSRTAVNGVSRHDFIYNGSIDFQLANGLSKTSLAYSYLITHALHMSTVLQYYPVKLGFHQVRFARAGKADTII
jgi:hypothetical protein